MSKFRLFTLRRRNAARAVARGLGKNVAEELPTAHCVLPTKRRGISLLEVLISMFVLLFGLMGVASLFPVGSHYAAQGEQFDRSTALSDAAFDELLARGMLKPETWLYGNPLKDNNGANYNDTTVSSITNNGDIEVINPNTQMFNLPFVNGGPGRAFVIDPIGAAAAIDPQVQFFPYANYLTGMLNNEMPSQWQTVPATWPDPATWPIQEDVWPIRRVSLPAPEYVSARPFQVLPLLVADTIFSLHDTLSVELPEEDDRPAIQRWKTVDVNPNNGNANNTPDDPSDDTLLRREYEANYTWLASVVPVTNSGLEALQPALSEYGSKAYDVSVAVFHRREEAPSETSERLLEAEYLAGGELILSSTINEAAVDDALEDIRPGSWIAVAGVNPTNGAFLMKWYRLLSLDNDTDDTGGSTPIYFRRAMLDGPEWPLPDPSTGITNAPNLRAILLPGIVSVTTRSIPMQQ